MFGPFFTYLETECRGTLSLFRLFLCNDDDTDSDADGNADDVAVEALLQIFTLSTSKISNNEIFIVRIV